jgi:3-dehydroquinate synthase
MACSLSSQLGMLNRETEERIIESLKNLGLPIKATNLASDHIGQLMSTIRLDKKVKDGLLRFILISEIGRVSIKSEVSEKSLEALFAQSLEN